MHLPMHAPSSASVPRADSGRMNMPVPSLVPSVVSELYPYWGIVPDGSPSNVAQTNSGPLGSVWGTVQS